MTLLSAGSAAVMPLDHGPAVKTYILLEFVISTFGSEPYSHLNSLF